jgi:predicted neutral ceramidase superfamily lipid hydrolase
MPKVSQKATIGKRADEPQGGPVKPTPHTTRLIIGDIVVFLAFAAIGRGTHNEPTGLSAIPEVILTAAPFAIGWFIVAPFAGAYRSDIVKAPAAMVKRTVFAWTLSWPVALALRWFFVDRSRGTPASAFLTFALVTFLFVLVVLLIWRWPYALNQSMKKD